MRTVCSAGDDRMLKILNEEYGPLLHLHNLLMDACNVVCGFTHASTEDTGRGEFGMRSERGRHCLTRVQDGFEIRCGQAWLKTSSGRVGNNVHSVWD